MSDLQIVLIVIGLLIIVAVIIFNWWQERKFHRQVEKSFSSFNRDVVLDDPKLDVASLLDTINETSTDHFPVEAAQSEQAFEFSVDTQETLDDVPPAHNAIDEQTPEPELKEPPPIKAFNKVDTQENPEQELSVNIKNNSQHIDIKSIISDAFSQSGTLASSSGTTFKANMDTAVTPAPEHSAQEHKLQQDIKAEDEEHVLSIPQALHPQIDLTAILHLAFDTPANTINNGFMALVSGYDKPVFVYVLDADKEWKLLSQLLANPLHANHQVSKIACSLQLADRAGAVSRNTLNHFQLTVETLGLDSNAHVEWQGTGDVLAAAAALDAFCIDVDKTIGFHLVHGENGAFTGTKLKGLAEAQGLTLAADGTFKYFDQDAASGELKPQASFVMFNRDAYPFNAGMLRTSVVKGVTFQLDIPHVKQSTEAYSKMVQVAKQMAASLNAMLVAENNKVLNDVQIEKVRQQLQVIHATMLTRGIAPGTDYARRLFS